MLFILLGFRLEASTMHVLVSGQILPGKLLQQKGEEGVPAVYLGVFLNPRFPVREAQFRTQDELLPAMIRNAGGRTFALLPSAQGTLILKGENGQEEELSIHLQPTRRYIFVHRSCRNVPNLQIAHDSKLETNHFAGLICQYNEKTKQLRLYLSTSHHSNWYGSTLFEVDGKGKRWKIFDQSLEGVAINSHFSWGSDQERAALRIRTRPTPVEIKPPEDPNPPKNLYIGGQLMEQNFLFDSVKSKSLSLAAHLDFEYKFKGPWGMVARGMYLIQSLSGEEGHPKYFQAGFGGSFQINRKIKVRAGYDLTSFSHTKMDLFVEYEAPWLGGRFQSKGQNRMWMVDARYSQPFNDSTGSQRYGLEFAVEPMYGLKNTRGAIVYDVIQIETPLQVKQDRLGLYLLYGF